MMRKISKHEHIFFMNQILLDTKVKLAEWAWPAIFSSKNKLTWEHRGSPVSTMQHIKYVPKIITLQFKKYAILTEKNISNLLTKTKQ